MIPFAVFLAAGLILCRLFWSWCSVVDRPPGKVDLRLSWLLVAGMVGCLVAMIAAVWIARAG